MLEIHLPGDFNQYVNSDGIMSVKEDATLYIDGKVMLTQILLSDAVNKFQILGDGDLTVDASHCDGIAIGNNATFGLSFGRYYLPRKESEITIGCHSITTRCRVEGCGIGAYGVSAIQEDAFLPSCVIRDTPINMRVYLKPLEGSTKYSATPKYLTKEEYEAMVDKKRQKTYNMLLHDMVNIKVREHANEMFRTFTDPNEVNLFMLNYGMQAALLTTPENFVEDLQRLTSTYVYTLLVDGIDEYAKLDFLIHLPYFLFATREAEFFPQTYRLPLSMRYLSCLTDMYSDFRLAYDMDPNVITDFHDLNLPEDNIFHLEGCAGKLSRNLYGMFPVVHYPKDCNEIVKPYIDVDGEGLISTNLYLHSVVDTYWHKDQEDLDKFLVYDYTDEYSTWYCTKHFYSENKYLKCDHTYLKAFKDFCVKHNFVPGCNFEDMAYANGE